MRCYGWVKNIDKGFIAVQNARESFEKKCETKL
jgi:hypothetical protein